jgi:hypothetical protein
MINKFICILLLSLFIILIYLTLKEIKKKKYENNNVEHFILYSTQDGNIEKFENSENSENSWTRNQEKFEANSKGLTQTQKTEVTDIVNTKTRAKVMDMITTQKAMFEGQQGPIGPPGPSGGDFISSGRLINKEHSLEGNTNEIINSITRTDGVDDTGKVYLEKTDHFSPVQYWYLYKDGTLKSRYDDKCLTSGKTEKSDLFMSECKDDNLNQKWEWNKKTNRIVSKDIADNKNYERCISLSKPKIDESTNLLAGCSSKVCGDSQKRFLQIKNCGQGAQLDEIWNFA